MLRLWIGTPAAPPSLEKYVDLCIIMQLWLWIDAPALALALALDRYATPALDV